MSEPPKGWGVATLGEITEARVSQAGPKSGDSFTYVDISSIDNQIKAVLDPKILSVTEAPSRAKQEIQPEDVLVSMTRPNLNAIARVPMALSGAIASTGFHVLRAIEIEPEWISLRVRSKEFVQEMSDLVQGALYPAVRPSDIQAHSLPIPPLLEQRRIVAKIEALMARSRAAREALANIPDFLDRYRQSVLDAAFKGVLTAEWRRIHCGQVEPSGHLLERIRRERKTLWQRRGKYQEPKSVIEDDLGELPEGWIWVNWAEVGLSQNGRAFPSSEYCDRGVNLLRPGNLDVSGTVVWTDNNSKFLPEQWTKEFPEFIVGPNQLVMNLTAQSLKDEFLGRVCLTGPKERCLLNQRIARLTPVLISPKYFLWLFKSPNFRRFVDSLNTGSLIQHMFTSQLDGFAFPLPPMEEQEEIICRIETLMSRITYTQTQLESQVGSLNSLNQSILAKAFRGELVPQDPSDEPAEVLLARIRGSREAQGTPVHRRGRPAAAPAPVPAPRPVPAPAAHDRAAEEVTPYTADTPARVALEALDTDALMAAFRQTLATQGSWDTDEDLLRALAQRFGYRRLGSRAKETLKGHLRAALLRRIAVRETDGTLTLGPRTLDAYTRDELIACLPSVLHKGQTLDREDLMRALLHHLGFQRLTEAAQEALKSAINAAIRRGVLRGNDPDLLQRVQ